MTINTNYFINSTAKSLTGNHKTRQNKCASENFPTENTVADKSKEVEVINPLANCSQIMIKDGENI